MKRYIGEVLSILLIILVFVGSGSKESNYDEEFIEEQVVHESVPQVHVIDFKSDEEEIRNEILYGELEELAILIQAESGNQDELGKRYVADCVLNRVDDGRFPDSIHDVIYQKNPVQFSTAFNGSIDKACYTVTEDCFQIALEEFENRTNNEIIYFRTERYSDSGTPAFKHGDHYFSK